MSTSTTSDWSWLLDTCWYVPEENLLAYQVIASTGAVTPIQDQTVFQITGYDAGYFWGKTFVQLGDQPGTCYSLFGSVTPLGAVLLSFTPTSVTPLTTIAHGTGSMCLEDGEYTMLNQMASGPTEMQINHWAYMVQTKPGDASWERLPGVDMSVEEFMASCS